MDSNSTSASTTPRFTASVAIDGARVHIDASSLAVLSGLMARLTGTKAETSTGVSAEEKGAVLGNAKPAADPAPSKPTASAGADDAPAATYDDIKTSVNALYSIDPKHAVDLLAKFKVSNGKQLQPTQWPDFVAQAKAKLAELQAVPA